MFSSRSGCDAIEADECYETVASREEIYLEEIEETARARFIAVEEAEKGHVR